MPVLFCRPFEGLGFRSDPNSDPDCVGSVRRHWSGEGWKALSAGTNRTKREGKHPLVFQPNLHNQEGGTQPAARFGKLLEVIPDMIGDRIPPHLSQGRKKGEHELSGEVVRSKFFLMEIKAAP